MARRRHSTKKRRARRAMMHEYRDHGVYRDWGHEGDATPVPQDVAAEMVRMRDSGYDYKQIREAFPTYGIRKIAAAVSIAREHAVKQLTDNADEV